jgi:protein TonB
MKSMPSFLGRALTLSLVLHAALIAAVAQLLLPASRTAPPAPAELKVLLREPRPEPELPVPPEILLPQEVPRNANAGPSPRASRPAEILVAVPAGPLAPGMLPRLEGEAAFRAMEQLRRELPYPPEAIERGLQGEALVLLFLDAAGNAIAARLEASSGHALLDEAALRAARTLRSLPDNAPREVLFPVRFRLR